jgi:GTPase
VEAQRILIGLKDSALKKVATDARTSLEKFFGKKIFLEVFVKVRKNWRNDPSSLKKFGYNL